MLDGDPFPPQLSIFSSMVVIDCASKPRRNEVRRHGKAYDSKRNEACRRTEVLVASRRNEACLPIPRAESGNTLKCRTAKGPSTTEKVFLAELEQKVILDPPNPPKMYLQSRRRRKK